MCISLMVYVLREGADSVRCGEDTHEFGLFSEHEWLRCLEAAGFRARKVPFVHSQVEPGSCDIFVGSKPAG